MAKLLITDDIRSNYVADVMPNGGLEVIPFYDYVYLNSSTGSGVAVSASCYLHSVLVTNTGASGSWLVLSNLSDTTSAAPGFEDESTASSVARIYLGGRNKYIYDVLINNALCYRLSGEHTDSGSPDCDGITIMYKLI